MKRVCVLVLAVLLLSACAAAVEAPQEEAALPEEDLIPEVTDDMGSENTVSIKEEVPTEAPTATATPVPTELPGPAAAVLLYQGHASMRIITEDNKCIYIDPFFGEGYDVPADLILITHGHYDHNGTERIKERAKDCTVITQNEALANGEHQSFDLGFVQIAAVEAGYNANHSVKSCVGYVLTFSNGAQLYVSGDTSKTQQMKELAERNIEYAFFCCDGVYNMDLAEASECAALVGAAHSIPYHMVPSDNTGGFSRERAEQFKATGRIILEPGEELEISAD